MLVAQDGTIKIADFGLAKMRPPSSSSSSGQPGDEAQLGAVTGGTPAFLAPEVCAGGPYNGQAADVWALGASVYMMRCGRPPYVATGVLQLYHQIVTCPVAFPPDVAMCAGLRRLLEEGMLRKDPAERWSSAQVLFDPWVQEEWHEDEQQQQGVLSDEGASAAATAVPFPPHAAQPPPCLYHPISLSQAEVAGSIAPIRAPHGSTHSSSPDLAHHGGVEGGGGSAFEPVGERGDAIETTN